MRGETALTAEASVYLVSVHLWLSKFPWLPSQDVDIWLRLKKPVPKWNPGKWETWTNTCGLPLRSFNFENRTRTARFVCRSLAPGRAA